MTRIEQIKKVFDATGELTPDDKTYRRFASSFLNRLISFDIGKGDATVFPENVYHSSAEAFIIAKSPAIIAGLEETTMFLNEFYLTGETKFRNGDAIETGETLLKIRGNTGDILAVERTILNVLQRLSGIATVTEEYSERLAGTHCFVVATRKTLWGMLDKSAVQHGGGFSHRLGLYDAAMLKENHLAALKNSEQPNAIRDSVQTIIQIHPHLRFIEIEVRSEDEFWEIADIFKTIKTPVPKVIMFDHFQPTAISPIIAELVRRNLRDEIFLEASGNVTLETVSDYAKSGVDVVSVGALTHSVKSADFSLLFSTDSGK